jgi:alpha/beta superfamily hydrolase
MTSIAARLHTPSALPADRAALIRGGAPVVALVLVAAALHAAPLRAALVVFLPLALLSFAPRRIRAVLTLTAGATLLGAGAVTQQPLVIAAGAVLLAAGATRPESRRGWVLGAAGAIVVLITVVAPLVLAANYVAQPREPISEAALGLPHERIAFPASDGVRLSGWWVPGTNGAAVVVIHGGGGDREGAVTHARMLAHAGYGVLLYDARGRGRSGGHANAFGWEWDRDIRGAVDWLAARGIDHVGLLGLSTGAEAAVTEAADDPRVDAVIADGVQLRTASDATAVPELLPLTAVAGAAIRAVSGEHQPAPLRDLVPRVATSRPLLLIATIAVERDVAARDAAGTAARVWELPESGHTNGLRDHPREYASRVLAALAAGGVGRG